MLTAFQPIIMHMRKGGDAGEIVEDEKSTIQIYHQKEYIDNLKILLPRREYFESLDMWMHTNIFMYMYVYVTYTYMHISVHWSDVWWIEIN